jgi:YidC/Oxa1 family membrane protein insertase
VGNPLNRLYEAVAWVIKQLYYGLSHVFGPVSGWTWFLSIVILVALMRLIMVPLFIKQMHTTRAMTALAPQMTALRKKYKGDKQALNEEMMKLYKEAHVNPLMGCLPVVAQLPMFFALFSVLRAIAEWKPGQVPKYGLTLQMVQSAQHAKILGATVADKFLFTHGVHVPLQAKIVILCTVVISMITTYLTVRQSMKRGMMPAATSDNPMGQSQKYMAYIMPFFALSGLYWPFGLVLYWVTTNLWTLGQQWVLFRRFPTTAAAGAAAGGTAGGGTVIPGSVARPLAGPAGPASGNGGGSANGKIRGPRSASAAAPRPAALPPAPGSKPAARPAGRGSKPGSKPAGGSAQKNGRGSAASRPSGKPPAAGPPPASAPGAGGGMLRRFGKARPEPEPQPEAPEVKLVRQQRQRQTRSKRSGKR